MISQIQTYIVDIPTIRPHKLSMTSMAVQSMVIVRITDDNGLEGIGEGTTIGGLAYGAESPESIKTNIDTYLAPYLIGQSVASPKALINKLQLAFRGNPIAKSAVQTALLDLLGKQLGVPVSTLLGGSCNNHLSCLWVLASGNTEKDIEEAKGLVAEKRHNIFKLKIGSRSVRDDVAHVGKIKAAIGDDVSIRVDVNQAWSESQATYGMAALQEAGIDLVEQPTPAKDFASLVRLSKKFNIGILADESIADSTDTLLLAQQGFTGSVALKIGKAGGLFGALDVAAVCNAAGIGLYGGTLLEGTVGTTAALHAWSTLPVIEFGTEMFGPLLQCDDIVKSPLNYHNFGVEVPTTAGLGLEIDEDKLRQYTRKAK
ncbi:muconate/chloromuconate family cycloisomerase [Alteromonas sp. CNT1-28]|jgi:muconate cycloisomerase|uniref:muconate/chloromuconate family cycloisomerase n=1 Tax=Alteromonas sp. CNT1-28 TaxID=2917730 RepID=UPI00144525A9|nr:muconate/chloromuconate family cycloisomerase [Alteromonas sp. CNT1-28]MCH2257042.1 muconate/chloromuconate family cycloisomerase [Alteromonas sp.]MDY6883014.1 muconate/chloromuconate family cycloisomerase [Pseudomonadota bacterium]NKX19271.1 muconate cycloisomerase [Alteromonadaceae bacterium A_SAG8]NKX35066.1 muconate cycloisomerase [Alteromonadaceae bacterium A_SAG3]NKX69056.1 muconate cycloisomerase [Alteromonadaceae bacterium A_SAG7]